MIRLNLHSFQIKVLLVSSVYHHASLSIPSWCCRLSILEILVQLSIVKSIRVCALVLLLHFCHFWGLFLERCVFIIKVVICWVLGRDLVHLDVEQVCLLLRWCIICLPTIIVESQISYLWQLVLVLLLIIVGISEQDMVVASVRFTLYHFWVEIVDNRRDWILLVEQSESICEVVIVCGLNFRGGWGSKDSVLVSRC